MFFEVRRKDEADDWSPLGAIFTTPENLEHIGQALHQAPIIVEHRFYRAASSPSRFVFDDYESFIDYLKNNACAGDAIWVWSFGDLCRDDNMLLNGKCPAADGTVPSKGAY